MAPLLALLPLILLPLAATAHPLCDHMSKNKHLQKRGLSGNALVTRPIDWSKYKNETFTYRGRTWTVPNQNTSEPYFDWNTVDGCNDDSYFYSCPDPSGVVLSYDDGPSEYTDTLLDILAAQGQKATLCVVGKNITRYPEVMLRAAQEGHDLCIHSDNHLHLPSLETRQIIDEVVAPMEKFKAVLGVTPRFFRPPYGEMDLRVKAILQQAGLTVLRWNFDSFDSHGATVKESIDRYVGAMKTPNQWTFGSPAGDSYIALNHDVYKTTVEDLTPAVIPLVPANGYKLTRPSECLKMERFIEGEAAFTKTSTATKTAAVVPSATVDSVTGTKPPVQQTTTTKDHESSGSRGVAGGLVAAAAAAAAAALL